MKWTEFDYLEGKSTERLTRAKWTEFDYLEVQQLTSSRFDITEGKERVCPSCSNSSVRLYAYESDRQGKPISISYAWCFTCHKYASSTGSSLSEKFTFNDPADEFPKLAQLRQANLMGMLDYLESLWRKGVLPQKFTKRNPS